ncbi:MAG: hypothetical protein AAFX75_12770 [Pseudomonadota bacterium]
MSGAAGGFWQSLLTYAGLDALRRASFVVLLPVYLVYLAPDALGALVLYNLMAALVAIVANGRLDAAMRRLYFDYDTAAEQEQYLSLLFSGSLALIVASLGVMCLLGPSLYSTVFPNDAIRFFPLGIIALATACANAALLPLFAFLRNRRALREYSGYSLFLIIANLALQVVLIVLFGWGLRGALVGALLPPITLLVVLFTTRRRRLLRRPDWSALAPSIRFSLPLIAFAWLYLFESRLDRIALAQYFDLNTVGGYGLLAALLGVCGMLLNALDASIRPWLYTALGQAEQQARHAVRVFGGLYIATGLLVLALVALVGSTLGLLTRDDTYLQVRAWLPLGVTALVPMLFTRFWGLLYLYAGRTVRLTLWTLCRTIVTIGLLIALTPRYGVPGVLIALLVSQCANALIFRVELARLSMVPSGDSGPVIQAAAFVAVIWSAWLIIDSAYPVLWGGVQCLSVGILLALSNRTAVKQLRAIVDAHAPAAKPNGVAS